MNALRKNMRRSTDSQSEDEPFMQEALRLAKKGTGRVAPNPMVGAVIVKSGRVIARGYHHGFGKPHAEIDALRKAGARAEGATLYVNLEPCNHTGKTPPCADALVRARLTRVVFAMRDPNPAAHGGIAKLRKAGVAVSVGMLERDARELNETFCVFHEKRRPFVALKFAASLDGKLATRASGSKWITNERARAYARQIRGLYQAVLVGVGTVIADNPHLGARARGMPDPLRVVLDSHLRVPLRSKVFRDPRIIIATTKRAPARKKKTLERRGVRVLVFPGERVSPKLLLAALRKENIASVLVEGGGTVLGSFLDAGLADRVYAFYAPILIGGEKAVAIGGRGVKRVSDALRLKNILTKRFDDNLLVTGSSRR